MTRIQALSAQGLRAVAVASRPWSGAPRDPEPDDETGLVFEGLCTFADPPKATAPAAVARLAAAGVRIVILSGDDPLVVGRLAGSVGLRAQKVITGTDLATLWRRCPARAGPRHRRLRPPVARSESADRPRAARRRRGGRVHGRRRQRRAGHQGRRCRAFRRWRHRGRAGGRRHDPAATPIWRGRRRGGGGPADLRQHPEIRADGGQLQLRQHALDGGRLAVPAVPADAGDQILLNNLLYDVSEIGIPFDNVRAADIAQPQPGACGHLRASPRDGPLSSVFDLATFGALLLGSTRPDVFRTGWFLESIATQTLVVFLIRTRGRPWRDAPSPVLTISTLGALALALAIPFSPLGIWFGSARRRRR